MGNLPNDSNNEYDVDDLDFYNDDWELTTTPIDAQSVTFNPKVTDESVNPICPKCGERIKGWSNGDVAEYRCGCDDLKRFEIPGSDD